MISLGFPALMPLYESTYFAAVEADMKVVMVAVVGLVSACTSTPAEGPSQGHICTTTPMGLVECTIRD